MLWTKWIGCPLNKIFDPTLCLNTRRLLLNTKLNIETLLPIKQPYQHNFHYERHRPTPYELFFKSCLWQNLWMATCSRKRQSTLPAFLVHNHSLHIMVQKLTTQNKRQLKAKRDIWNKFEKFHNFGYIILYQQITHLRQ